MQQGQFANPGSEQFQILAAGQQTRGDVDFAAANLEQQLEQVGHQRAFLAQRRAARGAGGQFVVGQGLGGGKGCHHALADVVVLPAGRQAAHLGKVCLHLGRVAGDIGQRFIAGDAAARDVLVLRFDFAPVGQRLEAAQHGRIAARRLDPLPRDGGIVAVVFRIGQLFHFRVKPFAAPGLAQAGKDLGENLRQVRHVADGIFDLPFGQRPARPVGKTRALVDAEAKPRFDKVGIADLFRLADRHHRDLRIEDRMRGAPGQVVDDFHILPAGVEDLQHVFVVGQKIKKR